MYGTFKIGIGGAKGSADCFIITDYNGNAYF